MSEENKALVSRIHEELFEKHNVSIIDEVCTPDYVDHSIPPDQDQGREGSKQMLTMFLSAFPDMKMSVEDMIAEGDKVVARGTASGTHQGEMMGIPPTGKHIAIPFIEISRLSGGKLAERWEQTDMLGMMQQLGVVQPPG